MTKKIKEALWPSMGLQRTFHYYRHRMFRMGDSSYKITAGLAAGGAVSFTPFLGTHILQAFFVSWILRGNLVAGMVGTFIGNPWTFPIMFVTAYKVGLWFCALFGLADLSLVPDSAVVAAADHDPWAFLSRMFAHPVKLLLPLTVGGYVCAALSWPVFYTLLYYPVRAARRAYRVQRIYRRRRRRGHNT